MAVKVRFRSERETRIYEVVFYDGMDWQWSKFPNSENTITITGLGRKEIAVMPWSHVLTVEVLDTNDE